MGPPDSVWNSFGVRLAVHAISWRYSMKAQSSANSLKPFNYYYYYYQSILLIIINYYYYSYIIITTIIINRYYHYYHYYYYYIAFQFMMS